MAMRVTEAPDAEYMGDGIIRLGDCYLDEEEAKTLAEELEDAFVDLAIDTEEKSCSCGCSCAS